LWVQQIVPLDGRQKQKIDDVRWRLVHKLMLNGLYARLAK